MKFSSGPFGVAATGFYTRLENVTDQGAVIDTLTGRTIWIVEAFPGTRGYGIELEASASPAQGLTVLGNGTFLRAEFAMCDTTTLATDGRTCPGRAGGADVGTLLIGVPKVIGNLSATYRVLGVTLLGDWHFVGRRFSSYALEGEARNELPSYSYFNFGASYRLSRGVTISADLLNAFQSKGLEEGNPRLSVLGDRTSDLFLARPILPRHFVASLRYEF